MKLSDWRRITGNATHPCSFCGRESSRGGMWQGEEIVIVCVGCLYSNAIPALVADALSDTRANLVLVSGIRQRMDKEFWRALYLAEVREPFPEFDRDNDA